MNEQRPGLSKTFGHSARGCAQKCFCLWGLESLRIPSTLGSVEPPALLFLGAPFHTEGPSDRLHVLKSININPLFSHPAPDMAFALKIGTEQ